MQSELIKQLNWIIDEFGKSAIRRNISRHISEDHLEAYMRYGVRFVASKYMHCVTISTIDVEPAYQRKGKFTAFLDDVISLCMERGIPGLVVESVINEDLHRFLLKRGFYYASCHEEPLCPNLLLDIPT